MQIHELKVAKRKMRKRIGRGGKTGTTAGRGSNGQKSRTGSSVDPLFEGGRSTLLERMKKVRGFKSIHPKKHTVTLTELDRAFSDGEIVTRARLIEKRVVDKKALLEGVKIVATGTLTKKLSLGDDVLASETAKKSFAA
jgi:large subunit ribosomal protein L15